MEEHENTAVNDIERFFGKPYWVVDFLPSRVPKGSGGRFFAVENYYLGQGREAELYRRFAGILLKLYCYYDIRVLEWNGSGEDEKEVFDPDPAYLAERISGCEDSVRVIVYADKEALFCLDSGDAYMTVYDPSPSLLEKLSALAASEGLFLRKP